MNLAQNIISNEREQKELTIYSFPETEGSTEMLDLNNKKQEEIEKNQNEEVSEGISRVGNFFVCPIKDCEKKFTEKGNLITHIRVHTGSRPYECPYEGCEKKFNEKGNLKTHVRIHTGESPYACTFEGCDKSFKAKGHLNDHIKKHLNLKPHQCHICNVQFERASTLKIHLHVHQEEKPYECPVCNKKFKEKGNMKTHVRTHEKRERKFQPLPVIEVKVKSNSEINSDILNFNIENNKYNEGQSEKKSENHEQQQKQQQVSESNLEKVQLLKTLIQYKMMQTQNQNQSQIPVIIPANGCYLHMTPVTQYHHMTPIAQYSQMLGFPLMHQTGNTYTMLAPSQVTQRTQMQSYGYYQNPNYSNNNNFLPTSSNFGPQVPLTYHAVAYPQFGVNANLPHSSY